MVKKYFIAYLLSFILIITLIPVGNSFINNIEYIGVNTSNPYVYYNYSSMTQVLNELYLNNSDGFYYNIVYSGK